MLNVIEYIRKNSLADLISAYSLRANYHKTHPNLVQLCYHQLDTKKDAISNNCRGLIIDLDTLEVVSFPFTRFGDYNYKNPKQNVVDFSQCKFYEKLDGSIITLYWYDNCWNVSTKGLPDASGLIKCIDKTYEEYFWEIWFASGYKLPSRTDHCYMFEFRLPTDSFLVKSTVASITLIGIRDLTTLLERDIETTDVKCHSWKVVDKKEFTLEEILNEVRWVNPLSLEGYVACDSNFRRCKIKSPQYENINLLRPVYDNAEEYAKRETVISKENHRRMCQIVRTNNHKQFLGLDKYKHLATLHKEVKTNHARLKSILEELSIQVKTLSGKELGMKLKSKPALSGIAFAIQKGQISDIDDFLYEVDIKKYEQLLRI